MRGVATAATGAAAVEDEIDAIAIQSEKRGARRKRVTPVTEQSERGDAEKDRGKAQAAARGGHSAAALLCADAFLRTGSEWAMCPARLTPMSSQATTTRRPESCRRACGGEAEGPSVCAQQWRG